MTIKNQTVGQNSNDKEGEKYMKHGLIIMDPKRIRMDRPTNGSVHEKTHEDITMSEIQETETHNQKNELKVGAAMQPRLEL